MNTTTTIKERESLSEIGSPAEIVSNDWKWRGWNIRYAKADKRTTGGESTKTIVCVHGFGANSLHFRKNIGELGRQYNVYSIDLLGFGLSDKPAPGTLDSTGKPVEYTFDYWSAELRDFVKEVAAIDGRKVALVANSIGCMVTMQVALENPELVEALVIISPSLRLLNVRKRGWVQNVTAPILMQILSYRPLGAYFLTQMARPEVLRNVLSSAYAVKEAIDDELISLIREPALTPGALEVFLAFITFDGGPIPEDFLPKLATRTMMIHGVEDNFEPFALAKEYRHYATVEKFVPLPNIGHCAMDEDANAVNSLIYEFLESTPAGMGLLEKGLPS